MTAAIALRRGPALGLLGLVGVLLLMLCSAVPARAALTFPPLSGRVVDQAGVLPPQVRADLTAKLAGLQAKTSRQLVVVTLSSLQGDDIADYGYQLGRAWGIGQKGINNGVLFITVPSEHKVRIEVGYGLEGQLTDALSNVILEQAVVPKFKAGDVPGGITAGTDALIAQLSLDPSAAEQKLAQAAQTERGRGQDATLGGLDLGQWGSLIVIVLVMVMIVGGWIGRIGAGIPFLFFGGGGGGSGGGGGGAEGGAGPWRTATVLFAALVAGALVPLATLSAARSAAACPPTGRQQ